jgi:hypothetical protein
VITPIDGEPVDIGEVEVAEDCRVFDRAFPHDSIRWLQPMRRVVRSDRHESQIATVFGDNNFNVLPLQIRDVACGCCCCKLPALTKIKSPLISELAAVRVSKSTLKGIGHRREISTLGGINTLEVPGIRAGWRRCRFKLPSLRKIKILLACSKSAVLATTSTI